MDNEETIKYFNVKNTSIRLVHLGGVMILPEQVKAIIDDDLGVNRATVKDIIFLEETDEDVTDDNEVSESKPIVKPAAKTAKGAAKTPTGAGWNAKG